MSKVFYVTGASSGFGKELVKDLDGRGHNVIATARNLEKIEDLANLRHVKIQQLNITDTLATLKLKAEEAISFFGKVDVLVNNAAYGQMGESWNYS